MKYPERVRDKAQFITSPPKHRGARLAISLAFRKPPIWATIRIAVPIVDISSGGEVSL